MYADKMVVRSDDKGLIQFQRLLLGAAAAAAGKFDFDVALTGHAAIPRASPLRDARCN